MRAALTLIALLVALGAWWLVRSAHGVGEGHAPRAFAVPPAPVRVPIDPEPEGPLLVAAPREDGVDVELVEENNAATRRLAEGALDDAIEMFERCHANEPENDVYRLNLAEAHVRRARALYEEHDLEGAVVSVRRALELAPERVDARSLEDTRERWQRELEVEANHWVEESDLFELSYDTDRMDLLHGSQQVLDHLERAYDDLYRWFGHDPVREEGSQRIRVVLLERDGFDRITGLGDWAGGAFDGVVRVTVEDLAVEEERLARVLTHELVHAFVHALGGPSVPGWLNEGLAQYLETGDRAPALARAHQRLGNRRFALDELQGSLATWSDVTAIGQAYAQSFLIVERIARDWGEEGLRRMVLGCAEREPVERSFEAWAGVPLAFVVEQLEAR